MWPVSLNDKYVLGLTEHLAFFFRLSCTERDIFHSINFDVSEDCSENKYVGGSEP